LVAAVPTVANWSMPSIPRAIPAESAPGLLASINRQTATGRRDYAILLLLARLGLRASEVACLELDDLDWEGGQVTVRITITRGRSRSFRRMRTAARPPSGAAAC
jgi:integrase